MYAMIGFMLCFTGPTAPNTKNATAAKKCHEGVLDASRCTPASVCGLVHSGWSLSRPIVAFEPPPTIVPTHYYGVGSLTMSKNDEESIFSTMVGVMIRTQ
jgi:hypothetical protein